MPTTLYAACLSRLGLTQAEAAARHGTSHMTVKNWCAGRSRVPPGIWSELRGYEARIIDRSEAIREAWEDAGEAQGQPIDARWDDEAGLMGLADFVLSADVLPG